MTMKPKHGYGVGSVQPNRLTCVCGHVESYDGDDGLCAGIDRLNAHIRGTYTDEEWEALLKECKVAVVDGTTGAVTPSPKGDKT